MPFELIEFRAYPFMARCGFSTAEVDILKGVLERVGKGFTGFREQR
jgi:hypothetical protein